jgi:hypothetical protein
MSVEETAVVDPAPAAVAIVADPPVDGAPVVESTTETPAPGTDRDDKGRFRNPVQPRIDELTRKVRENEREAAYWRTRAEAVEKKPDPEPPKAPTADQFDDYGEYVKALAKFEAKAELKAELDTRDKQQAEKRQTETRQTTWQQRKAEAAKVIPDIDAVLSASEVPLSEYVQKELLDSELGPQIAYHLDKHPEIADRLNGMTDRQVAKEIGRLEATLGTAAPAPADTTAETPDEPAPVVVKKTTNAPPPVKPIGQGRSTAVDLSKASMDDYVKARVAQGASWARR